MEVNHSKKNVTTYIMLHEEILESSPILFSSDLVEVGMDRTCFNPLYVPLTILGWIKRIYIAVEMTTFVVFIPKPI